MSQSQTTNPPSSGGPGPPSASTARIQGRKRSVQQAFDGIYPEFYTILFHHFQTQPLF